MGGQQSPPTLSEVAAWPADLRHDVLYLMREMGRAHTAERTRRGKGKGKRK